VLLYDYSTFRSVFATSSTPDAAGYETWPSASIRASGFDDGFTGIGVATVAAFPITITVGGSVAHHAYLSQRTDDPTKQYLAIVDATSYPDAWTLSLTALAVSELGLASSVAAVTEENLKHILTDCTLYVQLVSNNAIQAIDLLDAAIVDE
jgi:hypothetical protein